MDGGEGSIPKRLRAAGHVADKRSRLRCSATCIPDEAGLPSREVGTEEDEEDYFLDSEEISSEEGEESCDTAVIPLDLRNFMTKQCLPVEILALNHVVEHIHELLMTGSEAVVTAARTGQIEWLERLLDEYDCDVSEAAVSAAAANGQIEALKLLLPEVDGDYDGEVADAIAVAAGNGHLDVVQFLFPEIDESEKRNDAAWEMLEEASANGHYEVVEFAAHQASEITDNDGHLSSAGERCDALTRAISGGYFDVVHLLLSQNQFHWNIAEALEQADATGDFRTVMLIRHAFLEHVTAGMEP